MNDTSVLEKKSTTQVKEKTVKKANPPAYKKREQQKKVSVMDGIQQITEIYNNLPEYAKTEAISMLEEFAQKIALPSLPNEAPIKWAKRKSFIVNEIKDNNLRQKLQAQPDLEQKLRECDASNALLFLSVVYGDYIDSKLMYQSHLRGSKNNKALDKTLFDRCSDQCRDEDKDFNLYLPNVSVRLDREVKEFINFDESNTSKDKVKNTQRLITAVKSRLKNHNDSPEPL